MELTLITFLPMVAAAIILFLPATQKQLIRTISLLAALGQVALSLWIWKNYDYSKAGINDPKSFQFVEKVKWIDLQFGSFSFNVDYFLGVDGLSITMVILTVVVSAVGVISSWTIEKSVKGYFLLYNVLSTAMVGCFVALDFFLFYIFWELMLVPMYFLIGIWGGPSREYAAMKFFLYTLFGSVFMLLVTIGLYFSVIDPETGKNTFSIVAMSDPNNFRPDSIFGGSGTTMRYLAFIGLFLAFAIKVPVFPFHTWLPDAHVEAPTPMSVILGGILLKLGGYGFLRINFPIFPEVFGALAYSLAVLGAINIIYGAFCAIAQKDLKKMVAYSSVSHMGFVLLGIASVTTEGMTGAMMQMFSHGILTPLLFLLVGVIYDRAHTRDMDRFGGLASYMPVYTGFVITTFMASLGMPGLSGFIAESFVFLGAFRSELTRPVAVISTLGILLSAGYLLWALQRVYFGKRKPDAAYEVKGEHGHEHAHFHDWTGKVDLDGREIAMMAPLTAIVVVLGVYPSLLTDLMMPSMNKIVEILAPTVQSVGTALLK